MYAAHRIEEHRISAASIAPAVPAVHDASGDRRAIATGRVWFSMSRPMAVLLAALSLLFFPACKDQGAPEYVADEFVEAYFRRMDQQGARQFTAFGATEMLDRELELTREVRQQGYSPAEASAQVNWKRTGRSARGERVRFDYDIDIRRDDTEDHRTADIELAQVQSGWKVVRVAVQSR